MRSATDFLPLVISTLMNFATSMFEYFGSGRISRFGISLRLGIATPSGQSRPLLWPGWVHRRIAGGARRFGAAKAGGRRSSGQDFGFLAPYFERAFLRSLTPAVS